MTMYTYSPVVALDATTGELIESSAGKLFAIDDTAAQTPLAVSDVSGIAFPGGVVPVASGLVAGFQVTDHTRVMWVSGDARVAIWSPDAMEAAAASAAESAAASAISVTDQVDRADNAATRAEDAAQRAEDAADSGGGASDADVAALILDGDSQTRDALNALVSANLYYPVFTSADGSRWIQSVSDAGELVLTPTDFPGPPAAPVDVEVI